MVQGFRADKYLCTIAMKSDGNCWNMNIDIPIIIMIWIISIAMDIGYYTHMVQGLKLNLGADKYFSKIAINIDGFYSSYLEFLSDP